MQIKKKLFLLGLTASAPFLTLSNSALAASTPFKTVFGGTCSSYNCWIEKVWEWTLLILVPLSTIMVAAAGVIYMTAGANPDQVGVAKKMLWGVASGVALLVLARVLLVNFLGLEPWWNI